MCGIVGIWHLDRRANQLEALQKATTALRHRGPDDEGYLLVNTSTSLTVSCAGPETDPRLSLPPLELFRNQDFDLTFGFRRLSILDLSAAGHQPMSSADGRLWIIFNGEIYNYQELRSELVSHGYQFQTGTDTEVTLAAYRHWGESCLQHFNGMFAFAIWDAKAKSLFAARDRFGEKPFHYVYVPGKLFAFASEMKALWAGGIMEPRVHQETLALFTHYDQVDTGEQTFYEHVMRLPQAHCLTLTNDGRLLKRRYWDVDPTIKDDGKQDTWYKEEFRERLTDSIRIRLRADVPMGSSLSGGLDSSTVVAVINRLLPGEAVQKTFSARFDDSTRDEGGWMNLVTVSNRLERHDVWPTAEGFFADLPNLFWHQEEPFTSASVYAQWSVMRLAHQYGVTVLLDGQGADEMLGGYHAYFDVLADDLLRSGNLARYLKWRRSCRELHGIAPGSLKRLMIQNLPRGLKTAVKKLRKRVEHLPDVEPVTPVYPSSFKHVSGLRKLLWWNTTRQGLVELLRYADRNSMAHSREIRLPFLDHNLVEFVFRLPERFLINGAWTKWILREAFKGVVPAEITNRIDKLGYMPPQDCWLGELVWENLMADQLQENIARGRHLMLPEKELAGSWN